MGRGQRRVEKERLVRRLAKAAFDIADGFARQARQDPINGKVRRAHAFIHRDEIRPHSRVVDRRQDHRSIVFDIAEGRHVERRRDAEVVVEAALDGAALNRASVIHLVAGARRRFTVDRDCRHGLALFVEPGHSEMPLAHAGGVVALALQERADGQTTAFDQRRIKAVEHAILKAGSPGVTTRQNPIARRRANRRRRVGVRKAHAFLGQSVHMRRLDLGLGVVATEVSVPEIVRQDIDDVRQAVLLRDGGKRNEQGEGEERSTKPARENHAG